MAVGAGGAEVKGVTREGVEDVGRAPAVAEGSGGGVEGGVVAGDEAEAGGVGSGKGVDELGVVAKGWIRAKTFAVEREDAFEGGEIVAGGGGRGVEGVGEGFS